MLHLQSHPNLECELCTVQACGLLAVHGPPLSCVPVTTASFCTLVASFARTKQGRRKPTESATHGRLEGQQESFHHRTLLSLRTSCLPYPQAARSQLCAALVGLLATVSAGMGWILFRSLMRCNSTSTQQPIIIITDFLMFINRMTVIILFFFINECIKIYKYVNPCLARHFKHRPIGKGLN